MSCCRLETERLLLRPPEQRDAPAIVSGIGDWDVAKNLSKCPHPYREEYAHEFLARAVEGLAAGTDFNFAIERCDDDAYVGQIGLHLKNGKFEIGYWLGKPYWGRGYASEAARRVALFGFKSLKAESIWAGWFHDNPASGHVLEKLGCRPDGQEPRHCVARGHEVMCNLVILSRADFFAGRIAA
jgi:ribosomal-protein-alanine N-acetyltransferase